MNIKRADLTNSVGRNLANLEASSKSHSRQNAKLVPGVLPVNIKGRIALRITCFLRCRERLIELDSSAFHLRQDVIRGSVQHPMHSAQPITSRGLLNKPLLQIQSVSCVKPLTQTAHHNVRPGGSCWR